MHWKKKQFLNTTKRIFEFAVVRVYIEDRPLVFWDFMSHFTHRLIISGPMGYFWILIYYPPPLILEVLGVLDETIEE